MRFISAVLSVWGLAFQSRVFRVKALFSLTLVTTVLISYPRFLRYIETRPGITLADPILSTLSSIVAPKDFSEIIFIALSSCLMWSFFSLIKRPLDFLSGIQTYGLLILLRILAMSLVPLIPPGKMILLRDPLMELMVAPPKPLGNDLYFSGHMATICVLYLHAVSRRQQRIFVLVAVFLAFMLLIQHVHYSIDILSAPAFCLLAHKAVSRLNFLLETLYQQPQNLALADSESREQPANDYGILS